MIVEVTGDCPLIDPEVVDHVLGKYLEGEYDYVTNIGYVNDDVREIPIGMDVRVFSFEELKYISEITKDPEDREHVSLYFFRDGKNKYKLYNVPIPEKWKRDYNIRLTLDTKEDFELIKKIYAELRKVNENFDLKDILNFLDDNKNLVEINSAIVQKQFQTLDRYKVGIVGCGDIGFYFDHKKKVKGALTHFKAFNNDKRFEVAAVTELNEKTRRLISNKYKIPTYESYENMLEEIKCDVIVIATNDESHFEILRNVIKFEPKLVFCEKPMALSLEDVKEAVSLYKEYNIPLQINFTRRFLKEFSDIEKTIKEKKIGELESVTFYYSRGLIHNASHYLDLVNRYIGEMEKNLVKVSVKEGIGKGDESISFDLVYDNGLEIRFIGLSPSKLSFAEVDFVGTKGRLKVNYKNEIERYKVTGNKVFKGYSMYELKSVKRIQFAKALPNAVDNIFKVLNKKEELKSPAENSLKIFELINRIKSKEICRN